MFDSLLIANRGEIACRIIATARRLGIRTIAVYSDADQRAAHVEAADEAVRIGAAPAIESYLKIPALLRAASVTGVEAVHPGYGFLAENAGFASAVKRAGLIFVGPQAQTINRLGNKSKAKELAIKAGVPVVPGYHGRGQGRAQLCKAAEKIGFPVLIKAALGGGGRGMRIVENGKQMGEALESAAREAAAAFGDATLIIEKYLTSPRHIEVQIFADNFGSVVHMGTRDCSVQRRYQKIIEEAPAPHLTAKTESAMIAAAITLATASGYRGAGTVEFILDRDGSFYFMEMNTRLQVEHPVTEAITGEDLVEWQLRIAAGEKLPKTQKKITFTGHAIEARLCAEDPARDFLPSAGRLAHLKWPEDDIRIDTGFRPGDMVSVYYDSLLAKVIASGASRKRALAALGHALKTTQIVGPATNLEFLHRLARLPEFAAGRYDTGLVARNADQLTGPADQPADQVLAAAAMTAIWSQLEDGQKKGLSAQGWNSPWAHQGSWRLTGRQPAVIALQYGGRSYDVQAAPFSRDCWSVTLVGNKNSFRVCKSNDMKKPALTVDGRAVHLDVIVVDGARYFFGAGAPLPFILIDPMEGVQGMAEETDALAAPMPGRIARIEVAVGAMVRAGDLLLVLEAMKMEHAVTAPVDGMVAALYFGEGDQVMAGDELARIDP